MIWVKINLYLYTNSARTLLSQNDTGRVSHSVTGPLDCLPVEALWGLWRYATVISARRVGRPTVVSSRMQTRFKKKTSQQRPLYIFTNHRWSDILWSMQIVFYKWTYSRPTLWTPMFARLDLQCDSENLQFLLTQNENFLIATSSDDQ